MELWRAADIKDAELLADPQTVRLQSIARLYKNCQQRVHASGETEVFAGQNHTNATMMEDGITTSSFDTEGFGADDTFSDGDSSESGSSGRW
jgi:hypothetical protein